MSEQTKHDNRAVWDGADGGCEACVTTKDNGDTVIIRHYDYRGHCYWLREAYQKPLAMKVCSSLANRFGVELHPSGTAAKMEDANTRIDTLVVELHQEADANTILREDIVRLRTERNEARGSRDVLRSEVALLEAAHTEKHQANVILCMEYTRVHIERDEATAKLQAAEARVADLEAALAEERSVAEVLRVDLRRLHADKAEECHSRPGARQKNRWELIVE